MFYQERIPKDFEIELCSRDQWEKKGTHFHNCYEFYYLVSGEITYFVGESIYTVKKGDIILIPPNTIHRTTPSQNPKHKRILIYLKPSFIKEFLEYNPALLDCFQTTLLPMPKQKQKRAEELLYSLLNEYGVGKKQDMVMIKSLLGQLMTMVGRQTKGEQMQLSIPKVDVVSEKILEIVKYINTEHGQEITLDGLGKKFYMAPSHLSRTFKKVTGFSYSEYLNKVRIKQGAELLLSTNQNVTQVAFAVGFNSSNHFCKTFRRIMGISPLQYRKIG